MAACDVPAEWPSCYHPVEDSQAYAFAGLRDENARLVNQVERQIKLIDEALEELSLVEECRPAPLDRAVKMLENARGGTFWSASQGGALLHIDHDPEGDYIKDMEESMREAIAQTRETVASQCLGDLEHVSELAYAVKKETEERLASVSHPIDDEASKSPEAEEAWPALFSSIRTYAQSIERNLREIQDLLRATEL